MTVERVFFTPANAAFYVYVLLSAEFIYLHSIIYLNSIGLSDYSKSHEEMWDSHRGQFQLLLVVVIRAVPKYSSSPSFPTHNRTVLPCNGRLGVVRRLALMQR